MNAASELKWRFTLNSGCLFGETQPPASLASTLGPSRRREPTVFAALSSVYFNDALFMNRQNGDTARDNAAAYYRYMASLIDFPTRSESAASTTANGNDVLRFVGIVTQLNDPHGMSGSERNAPWEFYYIQQGLGSGAAMFLGDDETAEHINAALDALSASGGHVDELNAASGAQTIETRAPNRLSLFCGQVSRFTMLYPGAIIGVEGTPCRRDMEGRLTSLLVTSIVLPRKPVYPWSLPTAPGTAAQDNLMVQRKSIRIMFAAGPFLPRRSSYLALRGLVELAVQRQATVLLICGPLLPPFDDAEKNILQATQTTFEVQLSQLVETLEIALEQLRATNAAARDLHVVVVPSVEDVVMLPALPQPNYFVASAEGGNVHLVSNPSRIVVDSVHIGVANVDAVSDMRELMVERMQGREEGSLLRVAQALVQSRLYCPMVEFPLRCVDAAHLSSLAITTNAAKAIKDGAMKMKSLKHDEESVKNSAESETAEPVSVHVEDVPHIVFMPSIKPTFATTVHGYGQDLSDAVGHGSLLVNPMVWTPKRKQPYFLNVAEVTIQDAHNCATRGPAHEDSGVAVVAFSAYRE